MIKKADHPVVLSQSEMRRVAADLIEGEMCKKNLDATETAMHKCWADKATPIEWWQTPTFAVGFPLFTLILGAVLVSTTGLLKGK